MTRAGVGAHAVPGMGDEAVVVLIWASVAIERVRHRCCIFHNGLSVSFRPGQRLGRIELRYVPSLAPVPTEDRLSYATAA